MDKDKLRDLINKKARERANLIIKINELEKEMEDLGDKLYSMDDRFIKINCIRCQGLTYIKSTDSTGKETKQICDICKGKGYNWALKFEEKK